MPADWNPGTQWTQAFTAGSSAATEAFNTGLRMQQLRSQAALQKLQQQQAAEMLSWTMHQHHQAIDEEAQNAKNTATFMARIAPTLSVPTTNQLPSTEGMSPMIGPDGQPMGGTGPSIPGGTEQVVQQVPNPAYNPDMGAAYIESFLKGARDPAKVLATGGALTLHQAQAAKAKADAERIAAGGMKPQALTLTDPATGKPITMVQTGPNSWSKVAESATDRLFARYTLQEQAKMLDVVRKDRLDLYNSLPTDERGNKIVPDNIVAEVAKKAGLTTANVTKLEGEEIGAENVFALGKELLPLINENTTGARAELTRFLQRRGLTTLFPGLDNPEISVAETVGRRFSSGFVKAMKSDTNIGVQEQASLQHAAETINWTTMASGRAKLGAIVKQAADTSRRAAQAKGTPVNPLFLTRGEIRARLAAGDFGDPNSPEAANAAIAAFNNTAESFLQQINPPTP